MTDNIGDGKVWAVKIGKKIVQIKDFYWAEIDTISRETDYLPSFIMAFPTQNLAVAAALVKKAAERCGETVKVDEMTYDALMAMFERVDEDLPSEFQGKES